MKVLILPLLAFVLFFSSCQNEGSKETTSSADDAAVAPTPAVDEPSEGDGNGSQHSMKEPGQLTAGEWRDADHWGFWQSLMKDDIYGDMPGHWSYNLTGRIVVKTVTRRGGIAADVPVKLLSGNNDVLWEGRSDVHGLVALFPYQKDGQASAKGLHIEAGDGLSRNLEGGNEQGQVVRIVVDPKETKPQLDAAFVVDATGSMGDEMDYLKAELTDVIRKVEEHHTDLKIHTAAVFYRDEGDEYLTRRSGFSTDISETVGFIKDQYAAGGGDFPEAVHSALDVALNDLEWSPNARARMLFLVLDAPPHDDEDIIKKVNKLVALASKKGVHIVPVVSSGINKETEFLMRYMAIATGGTYIFLTDDSGIGHSHLQPTIGKYDVEYLNALLVRVIDDYVGRGGGASLQ